MAISVVIDWSCSPKQNLGGGSTDAGTRRLLGLLRARDQAAYLRAAAERDGQNPATVTLKVVTVAGGQQQIEASVTLGELEREAKNLDVIAPSCTNCPVNSGGKPAGCAGAIGYPITRAAEEWLLARVQPPDTVGGFLLLRAIADFRYDGSAVKPFRARQMFESPDALNRDMNGHTVSTDQLFHALLGVGPKVNVWHLGMYLCWVGALAVDGYVPTTLDQFEMLIQLPVAERPARTRPNLGEPSADPGVRAVQGLLFRMAVAWAHDCELIIDA